MLSVLPLPAASDTEGARSDALPPSPVAPADAQSGSGSSGAQQHFQLDPDLRKQIERTSAALDEYDAHVEEDIARLREAGHLDRRTRSRIRLALNNAHDTMTGMTAGMEGEQRIDGWTARMIAYELGMAADALASQANKIEKGPAEVVDNAGDNSDNPLTLTERQRRMVETLKKTSGLLRETAHAISRGVH